MKGIIGRKMGMTQIFDSSGTVIPVTVIQAGPCYVTQIRTADHDGYTAVQLGFEETKPSRLTRGQLGHLKRNNLPALKYLREFRIRNGEAGVKEGQKITVGNTFIVGDRVDIVGTSKGRGFAGTVKRHGFNRQPKTHGQSDRERAPGSSSSTTTPGRVFKGTRRAGHMGSQRVTAQNLEVMVVDDEHNLLAVRGSVPGAKGGVVVIKPARAHKSRR